MATYSKIERRMWGDRKFRGLSAAPPNAQTIWLYLLTGPHCTCVPGLLDLTVEAIAGKHRWPVEETRACFDEILAAGMAIEDREAGVILIPNALELNPPQSVNVVKAWGPVLAELPECDLVDRWISAAWAYLCDRGEAWADAFQEGYRDAFGDAYPDAFAKASRIQEQEQEQEEEGGGAQAREAPFTAPRRKQKPAARAAPERGGGVVETWCRLWEERHGTGYVPGPFCIRSALGLAQGLDPGQADLLEDAMRAFQGSQKHDGDSLDDFTKSAARFIASANEERRRRESIRSTRAEPAEERKLCDRSIAEELSRRKGAVPA